jgi:hypothetical protein
MQRHTNAALMLSALLLGCAPDGPPTSPQVQAPLTSATRLVTTRDNLREQATWLKQSFKTLEGDELEMARVRLENIQAAIAAFDVAIEKDPVAATRAVAPENLPEYEASEGFWIDYDTQIFIGTPGDPHVNVLSEFKVNANVTAFMTGWVTSGGGSVPIGDAYENPIPLLAYQNDDYDLKSKVNCILATSVTASTAHHAQWKIKGIGLTLSDAESGDSRSCGPVITTVSLSPSSIEIGSASEGSVSATLNGAGYPCSVPGGWHWSSSNTGVATVDEGTGVVYGQDTGTSAIIAKCGSSPVWGSATITVVPHCDVGDEGDGDDGEWETECGTDPGGDDGGAPSCGWFIWQIQDPSTGWWYDVGNPFYLCAGDTPPNIWETRKVSLGRFSGSRKPVDQLAIALDLSTAGRTAREALTARHMFLPDSTRTGVDDVAANFGGRAAGETKTTRVTVMGTVGVGNAAGVAVYRKPGKPGEAVVIVDTARATSRAVEAVLTGVGYLAFESASPLPGARLGVRQSARASVRGSSKTPSVKGQAILDQLRRSTIKGTAFGKTGVVIQFTLEQSAPAKRATK